MAPGWVRKVTSYTPPSGSHFCDREPILKKIGSAKHVCTLPHALVVQSIGSDAKAIAPSLGASGSEEYIIIRLFRICH